MKKTILVTGGMGYIGSHTVVELLKASSRGNRYEVYSIDNFLNSRIITKRRLEKLTHKEINNFNIDLTNLTRLENTLQKLPPIHAVIHFAALKSVEESVEKPLTYYHNNITSITNLLQCVKSFTIPYFIYSSSCSIYGNLQAKDLPVREDTPPQPTASPYGHTKLIGEEIIKSFASTHPVHSVSLRYFNPAGADPSGIIGEDPGQIVRNLVNVITQAGLYRKPLQVYGNDYPTRDGSCIRDYIHVNDIARAHLDALVYLENLSSKKNSARKRRGVSGHYEAFNLGTGKGVSVLEMISTFEEITGVKLKIKYAPRRSGDVVSIYSDSTKAKKLLKWAPQHSLTDMLKSAWAWEQFRDKN
ncbi:hypothetical protein KUTeg_010591 [Tegillarca granosa]|uniref:UDP-glucose 4-epimerase n=1 Tax=Tegillarca granosa TaxID=220873 RepID=A0ABQ9F385_TEGGR|nr:hypothetical protein KUTeg_010591 [Tegillarca granosa]